MLFHYVRAGDVTTVVPEDRSCLGVGVSYRGKDDRDEPQIAIAVGVLKCLLIGPALRLHEYPPFRPQGTSVLPMRGTVRLSRPLYWAALVNGTVGCQRTRALLSSAPANRGKILYRLARLMVKRKDIESNV